jgi:hypothetical protein
MRDLADIELETFKEPPLRGPRSGREAWIGYARKAADANGGLVRIVAEQAREIAYLRGEVTLLKRRIAERKPKGGKPALAEELVARLEAEIERGGGDRAIAARHGVSHMTVYQLRVRRRRRQLVGSGQGSGAQGSFGAGTVSGRREDRRRSGSKDRSPAG